MRVELRRRRTPPVRGSWFAHVEGLHGAPLARVEGLVSILPITAQYALRAMADRCVYGGSFTEVEHGENLAYQTVRSPRFWSPASYSAQFRTRYRDFAYLYWLRFGYFIGGDSGSGASHP